jgi:hypothetical protein
MKFPVQIADYNLARFASIAVLRVRTRDSLARGLNILRGYYTALRKNLCRATGARLA